ncbi:MAG: hypothetical protein HY794_13360 [Desulfarculus sp.]|nr:hypothetical protein [Desulfarculus sp.]
MAQGQYIGLTRGVAAQDAPGDPDAGVVALAPEIGAPGANGAVQVIRAVSLADYAASGYPELRRAQLVTVYRPWRLSDPLWGTVAWRIRRHQARILGLEPGQVVASHAMIYAGGGNYWSQGPKFALERVEGYRGCDLYHWDLGWSLDQRNALMGECGPHAFETYAYRDIAALALWSITGRKGWLETLGDPEHLFCSERVCALARLVEAGFLAERDCVEIVPHLLHLELARAGAACVALRFD